MKHLYLICLFFSLLSLYAAETAFHAGAHKDSITSIIHNGDKIITAAEDGFIVFWDSEMNVSSDRFQLTPYSIRSMVKHPLRNEICIIDQYMVSVWDFIDKKKLFSLHSQNPITYINYSASGNYIIVADFNNNPLTILDSLSGEVISVIEISEGISRLSVTGRNERTMMVYQSKHDDFSLTDELGYEGQILYINTDSKSVLNRLNAPSDLLNPVIFGSNRYIAGINIDGLIVADTTTGKIIDNVDDIGIDSFLCPADEGFYCLSVTGANIFLSNYVLDADGRLALNNTLRLFTETQREISISTVYFNDSNKTIFLGSKEGELFKIDTHGRIISLSYNFQKRITEIAVSKNTIAFLTENNELGFLPLDFTKGNAGLHLERKNPYTNITPLISDYEDKDRFIIWQKGNIRAVPQIIHSDHFIETTRLNFLTGRFPLRSVLSVNNTLLILDSGGNISLYKNLSDRASFSFSAVGIIDAALSLNESHLVLSRSVMRGNSPFQFVNINTSETISVTYPSEAGVMVFPLNKGTIIAAAVSRTDNIILTTIFNLTAASAIPIFEYPGEAVYISAAESDGITAVACSGEGAFIISDENEIFNRERFVFFERTSALPVKLLGTPDFFISLDSEGSIAWHDRETGKILSVYKLYDVQ